MAVIGPSESGKMFDFRAIERKNPRPNLNECFSFKRQANYT